MVRLFIERRDAVAHDLDRIAEIASVRGRVQHADVRAVADEPERIDAPLAQRDVEVRAEESRVAALRDHVIVVFGASSGMISAPLVPAIACGAKTLNSASSGTWLSVR